MSKPSFTAFKNQLAVGGTVTVTDLRNGQTTTRPITKLKTKAMATRFVRNDGEVVEQCWVYFPETKFIDVSNDSKKITLRDPLTNAAWIEYKLP